MKLTIVILLLATALVNTDEEPAETRKPPEKYILAYPAMDRCCPPIRSTFFEANRTFSVVGRKRFTHKPNGGYGLPIVEKRDGKHLLHLGADLGWHQVGEPVFAIGSGVVRQSFGPPPEGRALAAGSAAKGKSAPSPMSWGNVVMIEHRLPSGEFFTTIYGHLDSNRRVAVGDIVKAGQQVGVIGKQNPQINGGYTPHVHFAVRQGRMAEVGAVLVRLRIDGASSDVKIAALNEDYVELASAVDLPRNFTIRVDGKPFSVEDRNGQPCLPARLLWGFSLPDFALVGYDLTTDGWRDPIAFLREQRADTQPAPFILE
jgi:murein DD-endopeptidase MepM/ murein hydrolase activator NlpD